MEKRTQTIQHMMRDPLVLTLSLLANGTDFHQQKYILTCYTYTWAIHIYIYSIFSCSITVTTPPATYTNSQADDGGGWYIYGLYMHYSTHNCVFFANGKCDAAEQFRRNGTCSTRILIYIHLWLRATEQRQIGCG